MANNPYSHSRTEDFNDPPTYPALDSAYAVPGIDTDAPYVDNPAGGWGPSLRLSAQGIPDNSRMQERALRDFYPDGPKTPDSFYESRDANKGARHSVESVKTTGWAEHKGIGSERRFAPNPREIPPPEPRITSQLAPRTYNFLRPFKHGLGKGSVPNDLNGVHFSMADHRRNYEIGGMQPAVARRNTYRLTPTAWDTDIVDMPPAVDPTPLASRIQSREVAYGSRTYRLS